MIYKAQRSHRAVFMKIIEEHMETEHKISVFWNFINNQYMV